MRNLLVGEDAQSTSWIFLLVRLHAGIHNESYAKYPSSKINAKNECNILIYANILQNENSKDLMPLRTQRQEADMHCKQYNTTPNALRVAGRLPGPIIVQMWNARPETNLISFHHITRIVRLAYVKKHVKWAITTHLIQAPHRHNNADRQANIMQRLAAITVGLQGVQHDIKRHQSNSGKLRVNICYLADN